MMKRMINLAAHLAFALATLLPLQTFASGAPSLVVWEQMAARQAMP